MRYANWDVLLFLSSSRAPIQEFKTEAYVVEDLEGAPIVDVFGFPTIVSASATPASTIGISGVAGSRQDVQPAHPLPQPIAHSTMPLLFTFVPSQPEGNTFKISIHSWETLHYLLEPSILRTQGRLPCHQIRVFIDGRITCTHVIKPDAIFPVIIALNPRVNRDYLRWPQFHADQLGQASWSVTDDHGRIKILISEAYLNQESGFLVRGRNIIVFAFQHAPLQILKTAGIAWPNDDMWQKPITVTADNRYFDHSRTDPVEDAVIISSFNTPRAGESSNALIDAQTPDRALANTASLSNIHDPSLSLSSGNNEILTESPTALVRTAQRQVLGPRPANIISIASHTSNGTSRNVAKGQESQGPSFGILVPSLPQTPDRAFAPKLGSPLKNSISMKAESSQTTQEASKTKGKGRAPGKQTTKIRTTTEAANTSPNKVTKPKKPAARKLTAMVNVAAAGIAVYEDKTTDRDDNPTGPAKTLAYPDIQGPAVQEAKVALLSGRAAATTQKDQIELAPEEQAQAVSDASSPLTK